MKYIYVMLASLMIVSCKKAETAGVMDDGQAKVDSMKQASIDSMKMEMLKQKAIDSMKIEMAKQ